MKPLLNSTITRRKFLKGVTAFGVGMTFAPQLVWGAEKKKLNLYNWDTYIGENTVSDFAKKFGMKVQYDLYANNEELFAKLKEGNPGYDVIWPSDYMVEALMAVDKLMPIDHSKLPNMKNIDPDPNFSDPGFNPGLKYGVPYMWGTMGIGYRKSKVNKPPTSWKVLFDSDEYSGRIAILTDPRATIGITLKYLGYKMNSVNPKEIAEARDLLIKQKKHVKAFCEDNGQDLLLSGEVDVVMEWNGDIVQVMAEDKDLAYVVPDEGTMVWMDNVCIPVGAPNPDNAHTFINYLLDAKVNAEIANFIHYGTANIAAKKYILKEDLANPAIYPPPEVIAKSEAVVDVGKDARLYDEAWVAIQAG